VELKAFSIRDLKAGAFSAPYFAPSLGEGERQFIKLAKNKDTTVSQFADDFQLFHVGIFDDSTASYTALPTPQHVCDAKQVIG